MEKIKITAIEAEQKMFALLAREDMGDRIYEFAQELYQRYIRKIEDEFKVERPDCMSRDEEWYDGIYEDFFQEVYAKMIEFLTARY